MVLILSMNKKLLEEKWILLDEPTKVTDRIRIKCKICGAIEKHLVSNLLEGYGCRNCYILSRRKKDFIEECKKLYGDKIDYSHTIYINKRTKIQYICKYCGLQEQLPLEHLKRGCKGCNKKKSGNKENFINKANKIHNYKYDYSLVEYQNKYSVVKIVCPVHGMFEQEARVHLQGSGCPKCRSSKGEKKIREILNSNGIVFEEQKKFDDLKDKSHLSYDFYLPESNTLIEYNGIQHYENSFNKTRKDFLLQKHHDWLKRNYARKNNFNLIVIPFWENDIESILL